MPKEGKGTNGGVAGNVYYKIQFFFGKNNNKKKLLIKQICTASTVFKLVIILI